MTVAARPHLRWYSQILPSMFPIALLGSTVYIGLHLIQTNLARERFLDNARAKVDALEKELADLRQREPSRAPEDIPSASPARGRRWPWSKRQ